MRLQPLDRAFLPHTDPARLFPIAHITLRNSQGAVEAMAAFTQMMALGLFEKFPKLKCTLLEAGPTWITA